jgi:archaeosortase C (PEF-CTERM variant)
MTIALGGMLVAYNIIPAKYDTEARFTVIFLSLFFLTLSLPLALLSLEFGAKAASVYTEVFIAKPIGLMLNLAGIETGVSRNWVYYAGKAGTIQMGMGVSCSGIYSLAIFFSAFVAYVHVRYGRFERKINALLAVGLLGTYLANLLRVFIVALVGYSYGREALISAHQNLGWIVFMIWVAVFWYVGFRVLEGRKLRVVFHADEGDAKSSGD